MSPSVIFQLGLGSHVVTANARVLSQDNAHAGTISEEELVGQISILQRIAHDDQRIALGDILNGLLGRSNDGQNVVVHDELGSTHLVAVGDSDDGGAIKTTVVLTLA